MTVLSRNRCRFSAGFGYRGGRRSLSLGVADRLDFVQALLFFIDAHSDELDHRFGDAQAALQFVNQTAPTFDRKQNVDAVMEPADYVGQAALAHLLHALQAS